MASEIRVTTIGSKAGLGTITFSATGQDITGITTIANLNISDTYRNTPIGENSGDSFTVGSATDNTLVGYDAGTAITTGDSNTGVGRNALKATTTAVDNTAIGQGSLEANTTGAYNTADVSN